ncbi:MAG: D-Ala-D-Ala carboxypeptidase family metallohydrolase [Pseudomonadota bacterium]
MIKFLGGAALAATLSLIPATNLAGASSQPAVIAAVATAVAPAKLTPAAEFGLNFARDVRRASGLAPGQTAQDFEAWLARSPANRAGLAAFRDYLAAQGVAAVVPLWQLARTSSSWSECGAEPFEAPPADKWEHIATTLKFVRDDVVPRVGEVEALSAYRNATLNRCSGGAPKSAHREFFALDLTPINKAVERTAMIRSVCAAHARDGRAYDTGLGFYTGRRFHVDSSGFRKWGADGRGATSPCAGNNA